MLLIVLSFMTASIIFVGGVALGYQLRELTKMVQNLQSIVAAKFAKPEPPKPQGTGAVIVDPDNPVMRAKFEQDELRRRIND